LHGYRCDRGHTVSAFRVEITCLFRDSVCLGHLPGKNCRLSAMPGGLKWLTKSLCRINADLDGREIADSAPVIGLRIGPIGTSGAANRFLRMKKGGVPAQPRP
jgi:hypothetical protein